MRPGCGTALSTRSDQADLPPASGSQAAGKPAVLLTSEAEQDAWRLIEVFSRTGKPFEVELHWSSGGGSGASAKITVAHAARICVMARTLRLSASNLAPVSNRVGVTVADGFVETRNRYEVPVGLAIGEVLRVRPPPFAESFRVEVEVPTSGSGGQEEPPEPSISVMDAFNQPRATFTPSNQCCTGIALGGTDHIQVSHKDSAVQGRVVFHLSL